MAFETYIANVLSEHFKGYILLAYDYDGRHFVGTKIDSQQDFDALYTAVSRQADELETITMMNNGEMGDGDFEEEEE